MLATLRHRPIASETYRDAACRTRQLQYRKAGGRHVVVVDVDGSPFPAAYRFRTVEEARACWREQRTRLVCQGYSRA